MVRADKRRLGERRGRRNSRIVAEGKKKRRPAREPALQKAKRLKRGLTFKRVLLLDSLGDGAIYS